MKNQPISELPTGYIVGKLTAMVEQKAQTPDLFSADVSEDINKLTAHLVEALKKECISGTPDSDFMDTASEFYKRVDAEGMPQMRIAKHGGPYWIGYYHHKKIDE